MLNEPVVISKASVARLRFSLRTQQAHTAASSCLQKVIKEQLFHSDPSVCLLVPTAGRTCAEQGPFRKAALVNDSPRGMSSLAHVAASLSTLPHVGLLSGSATAAYLQLRDLHGRSRWWSSAAADAGVRTMSAVPQQLAEEDADTDTASGTSNRVTMSADGDVVYPEGKLLHNIQQHWQLLHQCPSAQSYLQKTSFDEFGHR